MEPPPYTEYGIFKPHPVDTINWDEISLYITPRKITPQIYEALLFMSKYSLKKFANEMPVKKRELHCSVHTLDLSWSRILWKIVHIFSESQLPFKFQLLTCRLLEVWEFRYVCCIRIISLLPGT
jgi:hypothetical protein